MKVANQYQFVFQHYFLLPLIVGVLTFVLFFPPWHANTGPAWFYCRIIFMMLFVYMFLAWNTFF